MHELVLPTTYEQSRDALDPASVDYAARLAQFVQPVEVTEQEIVGITSRMSQGTGRVVLLLGGTGCGKSTFMQSLTWRKHLGFARMVAIDCAELSSTQKLAALEAKLQEICQDARGRAGRTVVSIDYLESVGGISQAAQKSFFQTLNGLLRRTPVLIVWPVERNRFAVAMAT